MMAYAIQASAVPQSGPAPRPVRLFRNNRNEAIRVLVEFKLPGNEAINSSDGTHLNIGPVRKTGLAALLDCWATLDEEFPEIEDPPLAPNDFF